MKPVVKFRFFSIGLLLLLYGILISQKINLVTADLGRHIKNGEIIVNDTIAQKGLSFYGSFRGWDVFWKNLYSYSYPDFPFLNHHWGSGVIFYLIHQVFGFTGLSVLFVFISLVTLGLFLAVAQKKGNFGAVFLAAIILLPLIADRTEIRPEMFSYLFCGVFWWILKKKKKWIWLPLLLIIWVNLHVYFFLGFFLIGVFLAEEIFLFFSKREKKTIMRVRDLGLALGASVLASLLNPAGLKGIFYPLKIFGNYGYRVLENQSVCFLDKIVQYPPNLYFKIGFGLLLLSWVYVIKKKKNFSFTNLILTIFVSYLGWKAVRNFSLFGLFALPIIAENLDGIIAGGENKDNPLKQFAILSLAVLIFFVLFLVNIPYWRTRAAVGLGLKEGVEKSAEFFKKEKLKGPIFNNYDNGSYLVYYLFPQERVFVDNRPEAYPSGFFDQVYIPMQENEEVWKQMEQKYNFNVVFFYRLDLTPWAQTFLISRVSDSSWAPIYVDDYSIIFVKRNELNKEIIKKFELPQEMFSVKK